MRFAYFGSDEYHIGHKWGLRLFRNVVGLLQDLPRPPYLGVPEGPHFVYDIAPNLFGGRRGRGPLRIAWDTNLLIDYFCHGRDLWESAGAPEVDGEHGENLDALKILLALWVARDIQFSVLPRTLDDAKKALAEEEQSRRYQAFHEFATAVQVHGSGSADEDAYGPTTPPLLLPAAEFERVLAELPAGADRTLVAQAFWSGAHVFLTCDKRVLRRSHDLARFGLRLASPNDLLTLLGETGALHCLVEPERYLRWPFIDLDRVAHLVRALPPSGEPST